MPVISGGFVDPKRHHLKDLARNYPDAKNTFKQKMLEKKQAAKKSNNFINEAEQFLPQVKLNEFGELIVDVETMQKREATEFHEVLEDADARELENRTNANDFRKRPIKRRHWTKLETDMFYEVLSYVGTDFTMMHEYITDRSRAALKAKFTLEEKTNPEKVDEYLRNPALLEDAELRKITQRYYKLINGEIGTDPPTKGKSRARKWNAKHEPIEEPVEEPEFKQRSAALTALQAEIKQHHRETKCPKKFRSARSLDDDYSDGSDNY